MSSKEKLSSRKTITQKMATWLIKMLLNVEHKFLIAIIILIYQKLVFYRWWLDESDLTRWNNSWKTGKNGATEKWIIAQQIAR